MFPSTDTSVRPPLPSSGYRGRPFREPCGSPPSPVLWASKTARPSIPSAFGLPWQPGTSHGEEGMGSSPGFLGNPFGSMPRSRDSGDSGNALALAGDRMQPSTLQTASASQRSQFRSSIFAACFLAVYASHPPVARREATLASGLSARLWPGRTFTCWTPSRSFTDSSSVPPLPSFSQRDCKTAPRDLPSSTT
jgi:hypothetical protein